MDSHNYGYPPLSSTENSQVGKEIVWGLKLVLLTQSVYFSGWPADFVRPSINDPVFCSCARSTETADLQKYAEQWGEKTEFWMTVLAIMVHNNSNNLDDFLKLSQQYGVALPSCVLTGVVEAGNLPAFKQILPYVNPSADHSFLLALTSARNEQTMFDLLYPHSQPREAFNHYSSQFSPEEMLMLVERMAIETQRSVLQHAVGKRGRQGQGERKL